MHASDEDEDDDQTDQDVESNIISVDRKCTQKIPQQLKLTTKLSDGLITYELKDRLCKHQPSIKIKLNRIPCTSISVYHLISG